VGSVEALNKGAVIMSGFGGKSTAAWNAIYEKHRDFIAEFPLEFPNAMDESKRVLYEVNYVVKRITGFDDDDDLYKFNAAVTIAGATREALTASSNPSPMKRTRA